jgi:hypothetical protein
LGRKIVPKENEFIPENARQFKKDGRWFRDTYGRYALFRGVNLGSRSKSAPYLPIYPPGVGVFSERVFMEELDSTYELVRLLKQLGFNVVRLVIQWKALSPGPSTVAAPVYLDAIRTIIKRLFELGIYSLIDFHQDIAHEAYGGDGFPDWAIVNPPSPPPYVEPTTRWGLRYFDLPLPTWPLVYPPLNVMVRDTLKAFWHNRTRNGNRTFKTRSMLVKTICRTAASLRDLPGVLGYEPFNEPSQGSLGKKDFEESCLGPFYEEVIDGIAKVDPKTSVFVEPRVDWTTFRYDNEEVLLDLINFIKNPSQDIKTFLPLAFGGKKTVFAFHYYDPVTTFRSGRGRADDMSAKPAFWTELFQAALKAADERGLIPFMTEYGCDYTPPEAWQGSSKVGRRVYKTQSAAYLDLSLQQIEANFLNSTLWVYDLYDTRKHHDNWNDENVSLLDADRRIQNTRIVARPYPLRSSAKPSQLFFDSSTKQGVVGMEGAPASKAPTVIYVPYQFQYEAGFEVHHTGGRLSWDQANQMLLWRPSTAQAQHQLVICPKGGLRAEALHSKAKELLGRSRTVFKSR